MAMTKTDGEAIAVLQNQMDNVIVKLDSIDRKLEVQATKDEQYVTRTEFKSFKWLTVPLTILVTALITGLVYYYLSHAKNLANPDVQTNTVNSIPTNTGSSSNLPVSSTPSTPSTSTTTNNNTTSPPSSSSGGGLLNVPKVQGVN